MNDGAGSLSYEVLLAKVVAFVADAADVSIERVKPDTHMFEELAIDSLGVVLIFINLAETFGIPEPPPEFDLKGLTTSAAIAAYALEATSKRS